MRFSRSLVAGCLVSGVAAKLYYDYLEFNRGAQLRSDGAPKLPMEPGVLYLYSYPWLSFGQASPHVLKAETFLRLSGVPYVRVSTLDTSISPTGRLPMLIVDGRKIPDSEEIVRFIHQSRDSSESDLEMKLTKEQHALGTAVQRLLANSAWSIQRSLWVENVDKAEEALGTQFDDQFPVPLRKGLFRAFRQKVIEVLNTVGTGDLTTEQYLQEHLKDVQAIESLLGSKPFIVSESGPTEYDASAYTLLKLTKSLKDIGVTDCPAADYLASNAALSQYISRIDSLAFPDFDKAVSSRSEPVFHYQPEVAQSVPRPATV